MKIFAKQDIYIDGVFFRNVESMNKITIEPYDYLNIDDVTYTKVRALFSYFNKRSDKDTEYRFVRSETVSYMIAPNGNMIIEDRFSMPTKRNIPFFPGSVVSKGMKWGARGYEVHRVKDEIIKVPLDVDYIFRETVFRDGVPIGVFEVDYKVDWSVGSSKYFKRIKINSSSEYNWNMLFGILSEYKENFDIMIEYIPGSYNYLSTRHQGISVGTMEIIPIDVAKQYKLAGEIKEILKDAAVSPPENNEIKINISDILFDTGKTDIKPNYAELLKKLASKLREYPEVDIIVEGHTDDVGTREFNLKLSEDRARKVVSELIRGGVKPDKISYVGYGPDRPMFPNTSDENRAKNRRVEIKVIWGK